MDRHTKNLLRKASAPETDKKEQQEMLSLFHREDLEFEVKTELTNILEKTDVTGEKSHELMRLFEKIWKLIMEKDNKQRKMIFPLSSILKVAASLLIGLIIGSLVFKDHKDTEPYYYTSMAPKGSVSQMILPDSTFICLNSGSTLKYTSDGKKGKREVFLDGEAWFQVQRSAGSPFVVHTGFYDVKVVGTEFNVKAYSEDNDIVTTLEKGSVVVTSGDFKLAETSVLIPGEQIVYNKETGNTSVKSVNTSWFTSWKDNKLIFINMSLKELVNLLERRYGVDIHVLDPKILDYHYDGTIKNESIIEVLNLLEFTLPIDYNINDQVIEIRRK